MTILGGRLALVLAAERLFAERGFDGVSLRQVNEAAGQRNSSAAHYHFGSRDGVVRAVLEHRMAVVDARRVALLDRLQTEGRMGDPRALVGAWVRPLAEELTPRPEGNHYIRFLDQARRQWSTLPPELTRDLDTGWRRASLALQQVLGYLPAALVTLRLGVAAQQSIGALARMEAAMMRGRSGVTALAAQVDNLVDMMAGALTAPVSAETLATLRTPAKEPRRRRALPR